MTKILNTYLVGNLLGCGVGILLGLEAIELTAEAVEAGSIGAQLQTELSNLSPGEQTIISLDYDPDARFAELNTSNVTFGTNIDLPINAAMLQLSINYWKTGEVTVFP